VTTAAKRLSGESRPAEVRDAGVEFDVDKVRSDFPILRQRVHGRPLVYLDNAATSQKPQVVIDAIGRYYERDNANIHRGVHFLSEHATEEFEGARRKMQSFLNAADASGIIFVRSATEAINLVAQTYGRTNVHAGDEVLITAMEHHSNIVPWQILCEEKGARLRVAPISDSGELLLKDFENLLGPANQNRRRNARLKRAGHDQSCPAHYRNCTSRKRSGAGRWSPGRASSQSGRRGSGL
jgi:cysteine desulfurase/selenocysteine lyase